MHSGSSGTPARPSNGDQPPNPPSPTRLAAGDLGLLSRSPHKVSLLKQVNHQKRTPRPGPPDPVVPSQQPRPAARSSLNQTTVVMPSRSNQATMPVAVAMGAAAAEGSIRAWARDFLGNQLSPWIDVAPIFSPHACSNLHALT